MYALEKLVSALIAAHMLLHLSYCFTCDHQKYSSGCEDSLGSTCNQTSNQCECRPDFNVRLGDRFCLSARNVLESCYTSEQCLNYSKCFSNSTQLFESTVHYWVKPEVPLYPEGLCVCPFTHFLSKQNVCEERKSMEESCDEDMECLQPNGVCNGTTHTCECIPEFVFSTLIGHCVRGKYLGEGCTGREECMYSEEHSWCIDGICLCGAGYTPDKASHNGLPQCVLDSMLVEPVVPPMADNKPDNHFDYMTLLLIVLFVFAFIIALFIAQRNRNSIMQMIRPSTDLNRTYCDQSSHCMIPIDNTINSFSANVIDDSCKENQILQSSQLLPNILIDLHKSY